jgi:hypothetical protein
VVSRSHTRLLPRTLQLLSFTTLTTLLRPILPQLHMPRVASTRLRSTPQLRRMFNQSTTPILLQFTTPQLLLPITPSPVTTPPRFTPQPTPLQATMLLRFTLLLLRSTIPRKFIPKPRLLQATMLLQLTPRLRITPLLHRSTTPRLLTTPPQLPPLYTTLRLLLHCCSSLLHWSSLLHNCCSGLLHRGSLLYNGYPCLLLWTDLLHNWGVHHNHSSIKIRSSHLRSTEQLFSSSLCVY